MHDDDWEWLCNLFNSNEYKRKSKISKDNHKHLKYSHYCGTKSMLPHRESQRNVETGVEQLRIDLFFATHFKPNKRWISQKAEAHYIQMKELQAIAQAQLFKGGPSMIDDEICDEVLGKKSDYIKGLGFGPKPKFYRSSQTTTLILQQ